MNPATVYTQIRSQCNETADSSGLWTDAEILRHMTMAETLITQQTPCTQAKTGFACTAGTKEYGLDSTVGPIFRMTYDSVRLQQIDINQLGDIEGEAYGGIDSSGSPEYYYRWDSTVGFSPTPDNTHNVFIWHQAVPATIDSSAATAWTMPDRYGQHVVPYALWQMFMKDDQLQQSALAYKAEWLDGLDTIRHDWAQTMQLDQPTTVKMVDGGFID